MPVFLHQKVLSHQAKDSEIGLVSGKIMTPKLFKEDLSRTSNSLMKKTSADLTKNNTSSNLEIKQVVKNIFESSIVGGKERHRKMVKALGKEPDISESLIHENTRVGALFASKALVQLIFNPLVGVATERCGYQIPFLLGTVILLISSSSKYDLGIVRAEIKERENYCAICMYVSILAVEFE